MIIALWQKKTASIATGSWLSKQPGQVFDTFFKLLTEARLIHFVWTRLLALTLPYLLAARLES